MSNQPDRLDVAGEPSQKPGIEFEQEANKKPDSLLEEFGYLIRHERKWWLIPLLLSIAVIGLAVMLTSSSVAPFIYTLF